MLLSVPDLMPTLLGLMGLATRIPSGVQGRDYSEVLLGGSASRPLPAPYIFPTSRDYPERGNRGVRTHRHTFVVRRFLTAERTYLYDNITDPFQMHNIAETQLPLVQSLRKEMNRWLERTGDPWERTWAWRFRAWPSARATGRLEVFRRGNHASATRFCVRRGELP